MKTLLADAVFIARRLGETLHAWRTQRGVLLRYPSAKIDATARIFNQRRLELGANVTIQAGVILHCGGMAWSQGKGGISIGDDGVVSPHCVFYGAGTIRIGRRFDCGPRVMIASSRSVFEPERRQAGEEHHLAPVVIGDDVILFSGCIVSPGVTIGNGAVVGAGAIVLDDVPARAFVAGVPAKVLRQLP